ncbi:FAD-binding oxidoreductase [Phytohabitans sp. LJ34]|uniref:FAD-binding oxidoreductase n=1 Tax=Phytohabitans sp. LJ34 TaxID=3452217 RepID=UPI003F886519
MTSRGALFRSLVDICGMRFARLAGPADTVGGTPASWVAAPPTIDGVAAIVRLAVEHDLAVVARGAATKLDWGARPTRADLLLDTGRLAGVWHHAPTEGVAEIGAGTPLRAAQSALARGGWRLALDGPSIGATIGGVIAADEAGPLAHRYGSVADQLAGVSYVSATGILTHSGGRAAEGAPDRGVGRLLCGSSGALGVIVAATVKVLPEPASRAWVRRSVWTPLELYDLVRGVLRSRVQTAAVELDLPASRPILVPRQRAPRGPGTLAVLLEGEPGEVLERSTKIADMLGGDSSIRSEPPPWWGRYPFGPDDVALRVTVPAADLHAAIYAIRDAAGAAVPVRGSAGTGVIHASLPGDAHPDRVAAVLEAVRGVLLARAGSCVVVTAPPHIRDTVDMWGPMASPDLVRRVKDRFDPAGRLAPGKFFGV